MLTTDVDSTWYEYKSQTFGSILQKQPAGLFCTSVIANASVCFLLFGICVLQIVYSNRPATAFLALWNGSHLILFQRVKWQHDMLFYSVTFGCSEPADCFWCEESPCYYEPLVTVCLWGCCESRWVMQTCWSLIQHKENCFCGRHLLFSFFHLCNSECSFHYRNLFWIARQIYTKTF